MSGNIFFGGDGQVTAKINALLHVQPSELYYDVNFGIYFGFFFSRSERFERTTVDRYLVDELAKFDVQVTEITSVLAESQYQVSIKVMNSGAILRNFAM